MTRALPSGFLSSAERFPDRPALEVAGNTFSYGELRDRALRIAATIARRAPADGPPLSAVFAYRTSTAFAGVLGTLLAGHGYVPLNRTFPGDRTRVMLEQSGSRVLVVDRVSAEQLEDILSETGPPMLILAPENDGDDLAHPGRGHTVLGRRDLESPDAFEPVLASPDSIAYLLFTSGSTGRPKGAMVAHRNVLAFVDAAVDRYGITADDRLSQTFDMTFDLSVFDMFVTWERGACLCCPSYQTLLHPGRFINDARLTIWFSVPSTGIFMKTLGALKPAAYPTLRWSLFCGEPLPVEIASAWAQAAPASVVENLYGPTELTIACTVYRWNPERSPAESHMGVVPIGEPLPGMIPLVVGPDLREVARGEEGELLMTGPQVTLGYLADEERTAAAFVVPAEKEEVHYRTGDRVRRPARPDKPLIYLGRVDDQIKVLGHRVELGEIEAVLREESGLAAAIALGWPKTPSGAGGVVAFLGQLGVDVDALRERVAQRLPSYMVPRQIYLLPSLPLNPNGKFDRKALMARLEKTA